MKRLSDEQLIGLMHDTSTLPQCRPNQAAMLNFCAALQDKLSDIQVFDDDALEQASLSLNLMKQENERLQARLRLVQEALRGLTEHIPKKGGASSQAPGHCHEVKGKWDADGSDCKWCAAWHTACEVLDCSTGQSNPHVD